MPVSTTQVISIIITTAIITHLTAIPIEAIRVTDQTILAAMRTEAAATQKISPTQQVSIVEMTRRLRKVTSNFHPH